MEQQTTTLDLRDERSSHLQSAAFYTLRDMARGQSVIVLTAEEPSLMRDHKRLNALLGGAIQHLNRGDAAGAAPLLHDLAAVLKRHIEVEDGLLAPLLAPAEAQPHDAPQVIMQREHGEILAQLSLIEECLAQDPLPVGELAAYCSIMSGTLAKHEYREENNLFPPYDFAPMLMARRRDASSTSSDTLKVQPSRFLSTMSVSVCIQSSRSLRHGM